MTALNGNTYHSTSDQFNPDGKTHVTSGLNENGNLQIGFEDLYNQGDADFEDLVIEMQVQDYEQTTVEVTEEQDIGIFSGNLNEYEITQTGSGKFIVKDLVAGRDGTDTVENIEQLRFSDGDLDLIQWQQDQGQSQGNTFGMTATETDTFEVTTVAWTDAVEGTNAPDIMPNDINDQDLDVLNDTTIGEVNEVSDMPDVVQDNLKDGFNV